VDVEKQYPVLTMTAKGMTQAEIGRELHCTVRQVKYLVAKERARLETDAKARRLIA